MKPVKLERRKGPAKQKKAAPELGQKQLREIMSDGFCYFEEMFTLLEIDPQRTWKIIEELIHSCRGVEFSCGTMILKDEDAQMLEILTDEEMTDYGIIRIEPFHFLDNSDPAHPGLCAILRVTHKRDNEDRDRTFNFVKKLVVEERKLLADRLETGETLIIPSDEPPEDPDQPYFDWN